jgi:hypothetical protein
MYFVIVFWPYTFLRRGISFNLNDFEKHRIVLLKRSELRFFFNSSRRETTAPNALNKEILAVFFFFQKTRARRGFLYEHKNGQKYNYTSSAGLLESVAGIVHDY